MYIYPYQAHLSDQWHIFKHIYLFKVLHASICCFTILLQYQYVLCIYLYIFTRIFASASIYLIHHYGYVYMLRHGTFIQSCVCCTLYLQSQECVRLYLINEQSSIYQLHINDAYHHVLHKIVLTEKPHGTRVRESFNLIRAEARENLQHTFKFSHTSLITF